MTAPAAPLPQVALTAGAVRTPLGSSVSGVVQRLLAGETAARRHEHYRRLPPDACRLWAPVAESPAPSRHDRFLERLARLAVEVGREAFETAAVPGGERLGIFSAVGRPAVHWDAVLAALGDQRQDGSDAWRRGLRRLHPYWLLRYLSNGAQALLAADIDARGEGVVFGGPSSGVQALGAAASALAAGSLDAALVVAHDSLLEPESLLALAATGAATTSSLQALVAPYGIGASGFVPGEAAAAMVLEPVERAGARALARLTTCDAADGSHQQPAATTMARVLAACTTAGERALLIDGAARGTDALDAQERSLLAEALGGGCQLTAIAAGLGETGCTKPLLQLVTLAELLRIGRAPPVAGLRRCAPGPCCPLLRAEPTRSASAVGLLTGAPGAAGAIRVDL